MRRSSSATARLASIISLTFVYAFFTLAIFNVTFGLILALLTTAIPKVSGGFFRGVWLLPRMSPSVLYILLWVWVIAPSEFGLLNQVLSRVFRDPRSGRYADQRTSRADRHLQRIHRRLDGHDHLHLGDSRDPRNTYFMPRALMERIAVDRSAYHPARAQMADQLHHDLPNTVAAGQFRIHPAADTGWAVLRYDRVCVVHLPAGLPERTVCLRRRPGIVPDRSRCWCGDARLEVLRYAEAAPRAADRGGLTMVATHRHAAGSRPDALGSVGDPRKMDAAGQKRPASTASSSRYQSRSSCRISG